MYVSLKISSPIQTKAGKTARSRKYQLMTMHGDRSAAMPVRDFCAHAGISYTSLLASTRTWPDGLYEDQFIKLVAAMRRRALKAKARVTTLRCPHCSGEFSHKDAIRAQAALAQATKSAAITEAVSQLGQLAP